MRKALRQASGSVSPLLIYIFDYTQFTKNVNTVFLKIQTDVLVYVPFSVPFLMYIMNIDKQENLHCFAKNLDFTPYRNIEKYR